MGERSRESADGVRRRVHITDRSPAWAEALARLVGDELQVRTDWSTLPCDELASLEHVDVLVAGGDLGQLEPLVRRARAHPSRPKVVLLLGAGDPRPPARVRVDEVVCRSAPPSELTSVLRRALAGGSRRPRQPQPTGAGAGAVAQLTPAEARVLRRVAAGGSNERIASDLGVSPNTVRTHVQRVTAKLGAENRLQAVAYARAAGVLGAAWDVEDAR